MKAEQTASKNRRRRWGTIIERKDTDGRIISYQARYVNPIDPTKKVTRNFGVEYEAEVHRWLDEERYLVTLHRKGIKEWVHPLKREAKCPTFSEYAENYFANYRKANGDPLSGRSRKSNQNDIAKLNKTFGDKPLDAISEAMVNEWYEESRKSTTPATFEHLCRTFKRIMLAASQPQYDGAPPLISLSPCRFRIQKVTSSRRFQPPITPDQANELVSLFPDHYRLAIWISLLVGGLRIGEVCGLQIGDFNFDTMQLHVQRSVNRGPEDKGRYQLCALKTESSNKIVPIPHILIPMIQNHISQFCPDDKPETMLFRSRLSNDWLLAPNTVQAQFRFVRKKIGRPDISFHSLRATHATMYVLEGGTMREAMDELGHRSISVAVNHYQRIVPQHRRDTTELLAYRYMPSDDTDSLRTIIAKKEQEMGRLQKDIERLRKQLRRQLKNEGRVRAY